MNYKNESMMLSDIEAGIIAFANRTDSITEHAKAIHSLEVINDVFAHHFDCMRQEPEKMIGVFECEQCR